MGNPSESHHDEVKVKEEKTKNIKEDNPRDEVEDEGDEDDESDDGDDNVYEVERVAGHMRDEDNVLAYLIKWKGYDEKDNTYEKVVNCDDLIADYWVRYEAAGGKKSDPEGREPKPQVPKRVANRPGKSTGNNRSSSHAPEPLLPDLPSVTKESRESPAPKRQRVSNESRKDPVATKRQKADDHESEVEDDEEEDKGKKTYPPAEWASWDEHIREVQTVEKLKDSMVVHVLWKNGRETEHQATVAHQKFPQKLIHFYESHLKFTQA